MTAAIDTGTLGVFRTRHDAHAIPGDVLNDIGCKLYGLCSLAWDYIDTILDLCAEMRLSVTKPLCRTIRGLKRDYDRFRHRHLGGKGSLQETERGMTIEETLQKDFDKLYYALYNEVSKLKLTESHRRLVIAVQQAMTVLDAVRIFSRQCDEIPPRYGLPRRRDAFLQDEVEALYPLIPQFAGDCYDPNIPARKITARIIAETVKRFKVTVIKTNDNDKD